MPDSNPVPVNESRELDAWLAEHLFGCADLRAGVCWCNSSAHVRPCSSTYEGMGLVLAWLNEHIAEPEDHFSMGWSPGVEDPPLLVGERYKRGFWAYITHDLKTGESYGQESLPTAVALAAKAALQAEQSR